MTGGSESAGINRLMAGVTLVQRSGNNCAFGTVCAMIKS